MKYIIIEGVVAVSVDELDHGIGSFESARQTASVQPAPVPARRRVNSQSRAGCYR